MRGGTMLRAGLILILVVGWHVIAPTPTAAFTINVTVSSTGICVDGTDNNSGTKHAQWAVAFTAPVGTSSIEVDWSNAGTSNGIGFDFDNVDNAEMTISGLAVGLATPSLDNSAKIVTFSLSVAVP